VFKPVILTKDSNELAAFVPNLTPAAMLAGQFLIGLLAVTLY
jgi:hypothetical protein